MLKFFISTGIISPILAPRYEILSWLENTLWTLDFKNSDGIVGCKDYFIFQRFRSLLGQASFFDILNISLGRDHIFFKDTETLLSLSNNFSNDDRSTITKNNARTFFTWKTYFVIHTIMMTHAHQSALVWLWCTKMNSSITFS